MRTTYLAMIGGLLVSAACSKPAKEEPAADAHPGMAMDSGHMRGMGMESAGMMPRMQAHMDSMMRMSPEQMSSMMTKHERMMSQMMDQMGGEMRQMKMEENPEWSALSDSVKQDLAELPSLKGRALSDRMRAHADRVRRLLRAHDQMMKGMH
jgi:hypothetical protein